MSPEFALVAALETVPILRDGITPMQPKKDRQPPFGFYIPTADTEEQLLDGPSGLQSFSATLHLVAASYRHLQLICSLSKQAVLDMRGAVYRTPAEDQAVGLKGAVLVEYTEMDQNGPDLYEAGVGLYRRMYTVRLDYQTVEVTEEG